jgi:hypothetical protein
MKVGWSKMKKWPQHQNRVVKMKQWLTPQETETSPNLPEDSGTCRKNPEHPAPSP